MSRAREIADLGSPAASGLSNRNLIINGAMQVAQRGTSAVTVGDGSFVVDRFKTYESTDGAYTIEQSTDAPDGFTTSLKGQVTTADTSIAAGQYAYWPYYIEAQDLQHLSYGTSNAKTLTLSFWVKSSKTGVYTLAVYKQDTTSYMFTHEYTISSADTWENKTITITPTAGGTSFITTSGGAIANDNGAGLILSWNLSFGSNFTGGTSNSWSSNTSHYSTTNAVNWMDSTSNNFYLTGVQLELGEQATPFEHRSYGDELARCQRYYQQWNVPSYSRLTLGYSDINTRVQAIIPLATPLRSLESVGHTNLTIEGVAVSAFGLTQINSQLTGSINIGSASLTVGNMEQVYAVGSGTFYASGEL